MTPRAFASLIERKREGDELTEGEISDIVADIARGRVLREQLGALLMAITLNGLSYAETLALTKAMVESGEVLGQQALGCPLAGKHSTGGTGDKLSLVVCPLAVACGLAMPHLSGRGLGKTLGTLDKVESIPGFRVALSAEEIQRGLREVGAVIAAPTADLVPADREIYAARDITGTVPSLPLIAASILSKKVAESPDAVVFDIKVGTGGHIASLEEGRQLSGLMRALATDFDIPASVLLTDATTPVGRAAGHAVEVLEAEEVLKGGGPADVGELAVLVVEELTRLVGAATISPAAVLKSGEAFRVWSKMVHFQGGVLGGAMVAGISAVVTANASGYLHRPDAADVARAVALLGGCRSEPGSEIVLDAGVTNVAKRGDFIREGDVVCQLHTGAADLGEQAAAYLRSVMEIKDDPPVALRVEIERSNAIQEWRPPTASAVAQVSNAQRQEVQ